jgi:hypothetical protein
MMWKVKVRVDVIRGNHSKGEEFETMMDADTIRNCSSSGKGREAVEAAWCNSMFPGADRVRIKNCFKI